MITNTLTQPSEHQWVPMIPPSRYAWADVAFLVVNPTLLPLARLVERELATLGLSCTYIWTTHPSEVQRHWGNTDVSDWKQVPLPVQWYANTPTNTLQMVRGLRAIQQFDFRGLFGIFVSFIDISWSPRLFALACAQQGIPSVLLQEGVTIQDKHSPRPRSPRFLAGTIVRRLRERAAPQLFQRVEDGLSFDYACVYGPLKAESLVKNGKPSEKIFITGNPLFDNLMIRPIDPQPRCRSVLYAHQVMCEDVQAEIGWWRTLVAACQRIEVPLIFKSHPRGGLSLDQLYTMLGEPDPATVQLVSEGDIQDRVASAGVFVTACSTSAYRALIDGVPIVLLEGLPAPYRLDLVDYRAALPVYTPDTLAATLITALNEPQTRLALQPGVNTAIQRHLYQIDGQASRRVAHVLASLLPSDDQHRFR